MLDEAALGAADRARRTPATCCSRWRCGRPSPTATTCCVATWDSGRVGHDRAGTTLHPGLGPARRQPEPAAPAAGAGRPRPGRRPRRVAARGLPALRRARRRRCARGWASTPRRPTRTPAASAARLRRAGPRPRRPRTCVGHEPRAPVELGQARRPRRRRGWPGPSGAPTSAVCSARSSTTSPAPSATSSSAPRTAAPTPTTRRAARALRAELEARGAALRDLAARCVAEVAPAPRLAVPDVSALGPVPTDPAAVDAYLVRLDAVGRAMTMAQDAYAKALAERDELRGRLGAYAAKAAAARLRPVSRATDLAELRRRAAEVARPDTRPTSPAPAPCSRPTRPTSAAPDSRTATQHGGTHDHHRLHPARLHGQHPRRLLRRLRLARPPRQSPAAVPRLRIGGDAPARARQPGCTGTIVDGYCDVCGSPGDGARPRHSAAGATAGGRAIAVDRVARLATGSPRRPWGPRAQRPVAPRSPDGSAPPPPGCAARGWARA